MFRKKLIIAIINGAVILGGGITVAFYTQTWDPMWNPFRPEPEEVIERMADNMENLQSFSSDAKISLKVSDKEEFDLSFEIRGDADYRNPETPKIAASFYGTFTTEGTQFSLAGESKTIGETSYFKLTTIPDFPFLQPLLLMPGVNIEELKGQWIKIDKKSYRDLIDEAYPLEPEEELEEPERQQLAMTEKLKGILTAKKLYLVKEELPDEKIGRNKVYHYLVTLNQEEIRNLIPELFKILGKMRGRPLATEEDIKRAQGELDKFFEILGEVDGDIWISKKEELICGVKVEKETDMSKFVIWREGTMNFKGEVSFFNFDQPMSIEPPTEFKTIDEIFSSLGEEPSEGFSITLTPQFQLETPSVSESP